MTDTDTAPVRYGNASRSAVRLLGVGVVKSLSAGRYVEPGRDRFAYVERTGPPVATMTSPDETDPFTLDGYRQRIMVRQTASMAPTGEIGGYLWTVWVDQDDPTAQVAESTVRFRCRHDVPAGLDLRTDEIVEPASAVPPFDTIAAHEARRGDAVLAGFGWGTILHRHDASAGVIEFEVEIPRHLRAAHLRPGRPVTVNVSRSVFDRLAVPRGRGEVGSDRSIAQSPGVPVDDDATLEALARNLPDWPSQ